MWIGQRSHGIACDADAGKSNRAPAHRAMPGADRSDTRAPRWASLACLAVVALLGADCSRAQQNTGVRVVEGAEIAPFRLTGIEGYVRGGYWRDRNDTVTTYSSPSATDAYDSTQTLSNLTAEIFVMTHSYVYHPNLLLLDLGAGPVFFRTGYATDGVDTTSNRSTYNLSARATLLRDKPYRGALFYERTNDAQPIGPAQTLLTENTRYGFDVALLAPVTPIPMFLDATRFHSKGKGTDQIIDDNIDEANFRAEKRWGKLGETQFAYQAIQDDSQSGSVGLPIQATVSRTSRANLDTTLTFGERSQYSLLNTVFYNAQDFSSDQGVFVNTRALRFDVNLHARPTDALQTHARYQFDALDQTAQGVVQEGRLNAVNVGATYQATKDLSGTVEALASVNRNTSFDANLVGINGSANYRYELPVGEIAVNYGIVWYKRDQSADEPVAQVVGERVTLSGVSWVTLRRPLVVQGSVVVSNLPRTQTYVEGRDYILSELGLSTRIQRVVGGAISDGQEVLVDYSYDTGGTYAVTEFDNAIDVAWRYKSYFSVYARYSDTSPRLDSGTPTAPLNPATTTIFGTRADVPLQFLSEQVQLGGFAEWEDRREVVSPYKRSTFEAYAETSLPLIARGGVRVGVRQQQTNYDLTPEQDVTQRTLTGRIWSRFRNGLEVYVEGTRSRDEGSPQVAREYAQGKAKAQWRIRRFLLTLELARTKESQGPTQQLYTHGQMALRRDF